MYLIKHIRIMLKLSFYRPTESCHSSPSFDFEQEIRELCSPAKFDFSSKGDDLTLSLDRDKENLNDSVNNYHQIEVEANRAAELQIKRNKKGLATKIELMRRVNVEVKEELRDVYEEKAVLQRQVGLYEGKTEFLTRENDVLIA